MAQFEVFMERTVTQLKRVVIDAETIDGAISIAMSKNHVTDSDEDWADDDTWEINPMDVPKTITAIDANEV